VSGRLMAYHTLRGFRSYRQLMGQAPAVYHTALPRSFLRSYRKREYYNTHSTEYYEVSNTPSVREGTFGGGRRQNST